VRLPPPPPRRPPLDLFDLLTTTTRAPRPRAPAPPRSPAPPPRSNSATAEAWDAAEPLDQLLASEEAALKRRRLNAGAATTGGAGGEAAGLDMGGGMGRASSSGHRVVETGVSGAGALGPPGLPVGRGLSAPSMRGLLPPLAPGAPSAYGGHGGGGGGLGGHGAHLDRMASSEVRAVQALSGLVGDGTDPSIGLYGQSGQYGIGHSMHMGGMRPPLSVAVGGPYMTGPPSAGSGLSLSPASAGGLSRLASSEVRAVHALNGLHGVDAAGAYAASWGAPPPPTPPAGAYGGHSTGGGGLALPPAPGGGGGLDDATEAALLARVLGIGADAGGGGGGAGAGDDVHHVLQSLFGEDIARELANAPPVQGAGPAAAAELRPEARLKPEDGGASGDAGLLLAPAAAVAGAPLVKADLGAPELAGDAELASEVSGGGTRGSQPALGVWAQAGRSNSSPVRWAHASCQGRLPTAANL
jgi:hypothetical protein